MSQTASKPNQQIRIRPTLILGLGGFGGEVLLKIRRRFYEQHGSLDEFPIVAYRWLDTDGKRPESLGQIPDAIKLSDTERINLSISDPSSITANLKEPSHDHISPWWYPGLNSLSAMSDGVSHIRAYGRLAFFHHYSLIRAAIVDAQTKVRDPLTQEAMMKSTVLRELGLSAQVDFNSPTNVIIVSTISGGTGSGMLLDLTFMVKELLGEGNISSCAYLVFPEVGEEDDHQGRANGYAFLKELNHYQYGVTHYQAEWSRGQRVKVPTPPLDHCYLFDQLGAEKTESMTEATQELLAEAIFLDFRQGEFSDHKRSVRVNLKQYMSKTFDYEHPRFKQKFIQRYGSLGLSSLQLPHSRIINACSAKLAAAVVQSWLEPFGANETALLARDALLKSLGLFESEQNHDILFALLDPTGKADLDTGRTRGLMHQLEHWGYHLLSEVEQDNYRRQRLSLRDWLYLAFQEKERELRQGANLPAPIQANLDALSSAVEGRVQQLINKTLEQGGLKAAQSQLDSLCHAMQQQISRFEAHSNELQEHTRQRQNDFHKRLTELARQQNRRNWDGRTKIVLRYLTERFLQAVIGDSLYPGLLRCQLQLTLMRAGSEVSKNVLNLLQGQARADGVRSGGLQAQLQQLDRELRLLQDELVGDSLELETPQKDPHTTSLYRSGEVESKYFPAFVSPSVIQETSKQTLISLERSLLSLSTELSAGGRGLCKKALMSASRPAFRGVKTDFHLLKSLFQNFDAPTRLEYLKSAFQASHFWATASQEHGTFRLAAEQVQLLIGLPGVSAEMDPIQRSEIESYATQLKQLMLRELKADLNFFEIPDGSQLIIYREVAGFPLNYLERLSGLRDSYLQSYTSGEPLHTTCHDKQFADLMILAPEERESLEEAHECLVLGCIFDLLEYRSGDYLWIEKDVFQMRPHPLGDSSMLLLKLANQPQTRQRLMSLIREKRGHIMNSPLTENLARYAAVLEWHKQSTWGNSWGKTSDDSELGLEQLMTLRILKSELDALEEMVAIRAVELAPFSDMVQHFFDGREQYFRAREDQKLAFIPQGDTEITTLSTANL